MTPHQTAEQERRNLSGAHFSPCRTYRYALWRTWDAESGHVMFIGLNPSTADETADDPTIRRCIAFAKAWGYGGVYMLNLFALRATDPKDMLRAKDPDGPENLNWLAEYHERAGKTIAAWGVHGSHRYQDFTVSRLPRVGPHAKSRYVGDDLWCLGRTKDGYPRHPLYVKGDVEPVRFSLRNLHV